MCLPPISVISAIVKHSHLLIEANEHYQKRSYRNRIYLNGPQGKMLTTIPLQKGKNAGLSIQKVKISNIDPWASRLLKQIKSNYGSAPFFDFLYDDLQMIFNQEWTTLWDLNKTLLDFTFKHCGLNMNISYTSQFIKHHDETITDMRNRFLPGRDNETDQKKEYEQVFSDSHPFISDLSILDMLMCCGPESIMLLK